MRRTDFLGKRSEPQYLCFKCHQELDDWDLSNQAPRYFPEYLPSPPVPFEEPQTEEQIVAEFLREQQDAQEEYWAQQVMLEDQERDPFLSVSSRDSMSIEWINYQEILPTPLVTPSPEKWTLAASTGEREDPANSSTASFEEFPREVFKKTITFSLQRNPAGVQIYRLF